MISKVPTRITMHQLRPAGAWCSARCAPAGVRDAIFPKAWGSVQPNKGVSESIF